MPLRLVIGCYTLFMCEALKKLLAGEKDINITGTFSAGMNFKKFFDLNPDVVLLSSRIFRNLPENFKAASGTKILLMGDRSFDPPTPQWLNDFISMGGVGILPSGADSATLKKALSVVSRGELWLDRKSMSEIISSRAEGRSGGEKLTSAEKLVAALICLGCRNKEIAQKLKITEQTVKSHCNRIYRKVGVSDRLQLAIKLGKDPHLQDHLNRFKQ